MAIKTDAMIAHNGADGYTLHVDYDPDTDLFNLKAVFNDGTVKELEDSISAPLYKMLVERTITEIHDTISTKIGTSALTYCTKLQYAVFENAKSIGTGSISSCSRLKYIVLPSATSIAATALASDGQLEYAYIGKDCLSIAANSFSGTKNGIVIDCGFSSTDPAAANAPWGATNATVNYDVAEPNPPVGLSLAQDPRLIQSIDLEPLEEIQPVEPEPSVEVKKTKRSAK